MEKSREGNKEEQHLHTAVFAVIIGVLMACFERAVVVSLVEQWRARIFLLLNLILLSLLFTSFRCSGSTNCPGILSQEGTAPDQEEKENKATTCSEDRENNKEACCEDAQVLELELSEEELNQRVEAFIATFRQHLASDSSRKTRICAAKTAKSAK